MALQVSRLNPSYEKCMYPAIKTSWLSAGGASKTRKVLAEEAFCLGRWQETWHTPQEMRTKSPQEMRTKGPQEMRTKGPHEIRRKTNMKKDERSTGNQDETPTGNETPYDVYISVLMFKESQKNNKNKNNNK